MATPDGKKPKEEEEDIAPMLCCSMSKFGFHIAMNVGFSKQFRFSSIML